MAKKNYIEIIRRVAEAVGGRVYEGYSGRCNSARGNRPVKAWAAAVAGYLNHGVKAEAILSHVKGCTRRPLPIAEAKAMVARRGSAAKVLARLTK